MAVAISQRHVVLGIEDCYAFHLAKIVILLGLWSALMKKMTTKIIFCKLNFAKREKRYNFVGRKQFMEI